MSRHFPATCSIVAKKRRIAFKLSYWFCFNEMSTTTCKLLSLNVRGISNFKKRKTKFTWCRKQKADYIFLQETHSKIDSEKCWRNEWGGDIIMAHGSFNSRRVVILVTEDVDCTIHSKILDPLGQFIIVKAEIRDKMYVLINIYAPDKDSNIVSFFNNLQVHCKKITLTKKKT